MPRYRSIDEVFDDPEDLDLLQVRPASKSPSPDDRLAQGFEAINAFVDEHGVEPTHDGDFHERSLAHRLDGIRQSPEKQSALTEWDRHGLLTGAGDSTATPEPETPAPSDTPASPESADTSPTPPHADPAPSPAESDVRSIEDIWDDDDLGLLDPGDESIFAPGDRSARPRAPETIAQRRPCEDFWRFRPLFDRMRARLESGQAEAPRFQFESKIEVGDYFIVYGMLCLVDSVLDTREEIEARNPRLRVIFDNGTETDILKLSLGRALYGDENGRRIVDPDLEADRMSGLTHHDRRSGTVYILRSRSRHPALREYRDLVKIGYTEGSVEDRIRNAENDPAFLEGPVEVFESFACYNLDPRKFEGLVHGFLAERRLSIRMKSKSGKTVHPREWFAVSPEDAVRVAEAIVDGTIAQYRLDSVSGRVLGRQS
ncbi:GIY-YIG nuclease family protein [Thioalkalivibrio sp. ALE19]|uniref:GIY-YIG nuclease family protein n=1 Tax=Thioalkalivibrio sp. ALE19 TaxID=1266909 RepID=UPI000428E945|nr:GIY-YIG nuclease family protein [Thioalkalivibrio sp. ALE19]